MPRAKRGSTSTAAAGAAEDKKARKSPAPAAVDSVDPDYGRIKEYIAKWVASEGAKLLAPTEEEARAIEDLKQKRLGAANGTKGANGGHIETDHGFVDALWQKCKEHLPEELAYYLDAECPMLKERYVSDPKGFGKFLRSLHSSNRLAASGTSSIGIERMFHTAEHLAKMDEFLEKVKRLDPSFADLPVLVFERALLWGALRYRAWPDALTEAIVKVAACYYGLLLAINVMSGGYATMQTERLYARYFQQSEKLRRRHAGTLFEVQGGKLSAALGAHALVLEVANAPGEEGGSGHYRFHTRTELILIIAKLRVQAPNVSAADLADGGVAYAKTYVARWGDADGPKLLPGALGYTVWIVQPDGTLARLFGRECWGPVVATAIGVDVKGLLPKGERDDRFGYPMPLTPPVSTQERKGQVRELSSALEAAKATLAQLAHASGPDAVTAVEAVVARCGERCTMLEAEFAPLIAADCAAAIAAAGPALEPALDAFVQAHEIVMMHEARPQVAGGMLGGENAQIEVRVAQLRATWTGTPEALELAVEAMRKKAADDAIARGENAQIEVRVAQLRATWTGTPEALELAVEAMRKKAADDAIAGGENAQIEVRVAKLRATWTGTPEALELAVEAMRKKAADDAIARGENAQIEVRVAQLRARWTGTLEELELAVEAMRKKAADDAIARGQGHRQTKGDVVRLELVLPAGDSRTQLPLISTPDLEISFKGASQPNSRRVALNKTVCTNLGFAHLLSSKATPLLVSLKFSPTNEMTITSKLGTSLKPGWEGAELRAVLVRKAAGVAAKDDKEDEEDDA